MARSIAFGRPGGGRKKGQPTRTRCAEAALPQEFARSGKSGSGWAATMGVSSASSGAGSSRQHAAEAVEMGGRAAAPSAHLHDGGGGGGGGGDDDDDDDDLESGLEPGWTPPDPSKPEGGIRFLAMGRSADRVLVASYAHRSDSALSARRFQAVVSRVLAGAATLDHYPRLTVTDREAGTVHYDTDASLGAVFLVVTTPNYPQRLAFRCLAELRDKVRSHACMHAGHVTSPAASRRAA